MTLKSKMTLVGGNYIGGLSSQPIGLLPYFEFYEHHFIPIFEKEHTALVSVKSGNTK